MTYADLDINQKIEFKQVLDAWSRVAVDRFGQSLDRRVYRVRTTRTGTRATNKNATGNLKQNWWRTATESGVVLQFLQYGRFVDMGVGKGTRHTDRLVNRQLREGGTGRKRRAWYAKTKTHEIKKLREIMANLGVDLPLNFVESALNLTVNRTI